MFEASVAHCHIVGTAPLTQSRKHDEPMIKGEKHDDYDIRTWRSKLTVSQDGTSVVIPSFGMKMAIASAARYTKRKIVGMGNSTWTAKFNSGILVGEPPRLNIDPAAVQCIAVSVNADGVRGSGKRVTRRFPVMYAWETKFEVLILDDIITRDIFNEMLERAGVFIGLCQHRPENGGVNGRFHVAGFDWEDNRQLAA